MELLHEEYKAGAELFMHIGDISYANGQERVRGDTRGVRAECWCSLAGCAMPGVLHIGCGTGQGRWLGQCSPVVVGSVTLLLPPLGCQGSTSRLNVCLFACRSQIWDTFMESIEPFARHIPYLVGVGNHGALPRVLGWLLAVGVGPCAEHGCGLGSHNRFTRDVIWVPTQLAHPPSKPWISEYGYELGGGRNRAIPDASGETEPYQPDWGNFGELLCTALLCWDAVYCSS